MNARRVRWQVWPLPNLLICFNLRSARQTPPAEQNEGGSIGYSLIATPLKEATPIALDVATWLRSPNASIENTATCAPSAAV